MGQHREEVRCISDSLNMMRLPLEVSPFNPSPLRDSPGGALGTVFPKPLASLRSEFVVLHYYYYI